MHGLKVTPWIAWLYNQGHWHSWSSVVRKLATTIAKVWVQISLMLLSARYFEKKNNET